MKLKYLYITLLVVALLVLLIILNYYINLRKKATSFSSKNKRPVRSILFIGDSNTNAPFSYADQLRPFLPGVSITKIAQDGAKTDWMLTQLRNELGKNHYDVVSILGGSNDIYGTNSISAAMSNLNSMYLLAKQSGSIVIAITPPNKDYYVNKTDQKQKLLSDLVNWVINNPLPDGFINFKEMTADKSYFSAADGYLHPQASAHKKLADKFYNKIV